MIADKYELKSYLEKHPWPLRFSQERQVEYLYRFHSELSPEKLWPYLSDTSWLCGKLGLTAVKFTEKDGKLYGRGKLAGFKHEWQEIPWQWEFPVEIKMSREYSRGFVSHLRAHFFIEKSDDDSLLINIYFGWVPTGIKGRIILLAAKKRYEKKFRQLLENHNNDRDEKEYSYLNPQVSQTINKTKAGKSTTDMELLQNLKNSIIEKGAPEPVTEALANFIITASDDTLFRMRPKEIAFKMGVNPDDLISTMLYSCRAGLLNMSWDVICPHCHRVRENRPALSEIGKKASCSLCGINFDSTSLNGLEITFTVNSRVRTVHREIFCSSEPAEKPHILLQKYIGPGHKFLYSLPSSETRLRFREQGKKYYGLLDIKKSSTVKTLYWDDISASTIIETAPGSSVFITNTENNEKGFIIEQNGDDIHALRPSDLFGSQKFRDLFKDEAIGGDIAIDIGLQNIMFIDIASFGDFQKNSGDNEAFRIIKKYSATIHETAAAQNGAIVRTAGEGLLLTFQRPMNAVKAGIKLLKKFNGEEDRPLMVRITLHRGKCMAVNHDSAIDYFGQSVYTASRLQNYTGPGEMTLTEDFTSEFTVDKYLNEKGYSKNYSTAEINGSGSIKYLKIRVRR